MKWGCSEYENKLVRNSRQASCWHLAQLFHPPQKRICSWTEISFLQNDKKGVSNCSSNDYSNMQYVVQYHFDTKASPLKNAQFLVAFYLFLFAMVLRCLLTLPHWGCCWLRNYKWSCLFRQTCFGWTQNYKLQNGVVYLHNDLLCHRSCHEYWDKSVLSRFSLWHATTKK